MEYWRGHLRVISTGRLELLLPLKNVALRHVSSLVPAQTTLEKRTTMRRQQRTISGWNVHLDNISLDRKMRFNEWWLVLSRVNLLAAGEIAYNGHIIMISRSTIPRLGSSEWYKYLVYRGVGWTWFKLESCLWSVVSYVEASNTWGPRARTCQISYHKSKLSLFWINAMVHKLKWKKETQGTTPFSNVLKLLFWEFFHFAKQISSGF